MNAEKIISSKELFMERFSKNVSMYPDDPAVIDVATGYKITYKELDELSGKVYRKLSADGIGKENVVMISLTRGISPFVAMIGVWKAGAAFTVLEMDYPQEKRDYIYANSNCTLLLDNDMFHAMMKFPSKPGYEKTGLHDLAYIVYTSGTTGNPKGVMHEFGSQTLSAVSAICNGQWLYERQDRVALSTPLNFAATLLISLPVFYNAATIAVLPLTIVRNPQKLYSAMKDFKINVAFFTPSLVRLLPDFYDGFKTLMLGAEPVNDIRPDVPNVFSMYSQSEAGYGITNFKIDRPYAPTPIGKPCLGPEILLLIDDDGNIISGEGSGELCYYNPFFRGYVGLKEMTEKATAGGYIHSGDIVKRLPDGNLVFQGRNDDMVKINGNRVEPGEIEKALRDVLGIEWAAAKAFLDGNRAFICAYYTEEPKIPIEEAKTKLRKKLTSYMVPAQFIKIDEIPLNANGKFSRKMLPDPVQEDSTTEYVAPANDRETAICEAMARVLGLDKVGATNDFYELGGDSIRSISLITELQWDNLEAGMIFNGRTPRKIAELYEEASKNSSGISMESKNKEAQSKDHPLLLTQSYMFDYQLYVPNSTTWNLSMLLRFNQDIDMERVRDAVIETMKAHPAFSTIYTFNDDTELVQRFVPTTEFNLEIEHTTETMFVDTMETLIQPYKLLNNYLYRVRLFETERGGYLFLDLHHSIADGTSLHVILDDIQNAYEGKKPEKDYYFLNLENRLTQMNSALYEEGRAYYEKLLDQNEWVCYPQVDTETEEHAYGKMESLFPVNEACYQKLHEKYGLSKSAFYIAAAIMSIGAYNHKMDVRISWLFNGRETAIEQHIVGALIKDLYVGIRMKKDMTLKTLYSDVLRQIQKNIEYSCYPYPGPERISDEGEDASLIFQGGLRSFSSSRELQYTMITIPSGEAVADNLLDIEIHETPDGCKLFMEYNGACYTEESINKFRRIITRTACMMAEKADDPDFTIDEMFKAVQE